MIIHNIKNYISEFKDYTELRSQENRSSGITVMDGNVISNTENRSSGIAARVYKDGYWGMASNPIQSEAEVKAVIKKAQNNAAFFSTYKPTKAKQLMHQAAEGKNTFFSSKARHSQKEYIEFLLALNNFAKKKFPKLSSIMFRLASLDMEKNLVTSEASLSHSMIPRAFVVTEFNYVKNNHPVSLYELWGGLGQIEDHVKEIAFYEEKMENLYKEVLDKSEGVYAKPGMHDVILDSRLAGILAHEAIGHTTEGDLVQAGSIAGEFLNKKVASDIVTLKDMANTFQGETLPVPVYIDDEGTKAEDVTIIENGVLKGFMHNKETAAHFGHKPTGNARAYDFHDEPLVRMRNTAIIPGNDNVNDMIRSIKDGYYLTRTSNGQADATSEFMFGVTMGYQIKDGKIGKAIKDTTISGVAFDLLKTVSMISNEMHWSSAGMCGKKQMIPVGMGGPAIKCKVNIGGKE